MRAYFTHLPVPRTSAEREWDVPAWLVGPLDDGVGMNEGEAVPRPYGVRVARGGLPVE